MIGLWLYFLFTPVVLLEKGTTYYLRPGTSKKKFISDLSDKRIIQYQQLFSLYVYAHVKTQLKTGEYLFPEGSSVFSIWRQVSNGRGLVYHPFTIIPGWSFNQLRNALSQSSNLRHQVSQLNDEQIMRRLKQLALKPEGMFFPDTYFYTRGVSDLVILKKAYLLMQQKLNELWLNRTHNLPFKNKYEALIAASMVEKEAHLSYERTVIAGVLINRLRKNMLLQFDPTIIYGLGDRYDGKIYKKDLLEDTAFNTYLHKGLPPTPIAMPSLAAIEAVMHPDHHDYLYFVAMGDGSHRFSKTLLEHQAAVAEVEALEKEQSWYFNKSKVRNYLKPALKQSSLKIDNLY